MGIYHFFFTGLPYYAGMPGVPSAFQYGPTVFVPPGSAKQPGMGLANPSNQYHQQHQPNYGQHAYGAGKTRTKQEGCHCTDWLVFPDSTSYFSQLMIKCLKLGIHPVFIWCILLKPVLCIWTQVYLKNVTAKISQSHKLSQPLATRKRWKGYLIWWTSPVGKVLVVIGALSGQSLLCYDSKKYTSYCLVEVQKFWRKDSLNSIMCIPRPWNELRVDSVEGEKTI